MSDELGSAPESGSQELRKNLVTCEICSTRYDADRFAKCPKCEEKRLASGGMAHPAPTRPEAPAPRPAASPGRPAAASPGATSASPSRPTAGVAASLEYQQAELKRLDQGLILQERVLHAQVASAMYLRAGLMLAFTLLATLGALQQGNAAEQEKTLKCLGNAYCSVTGGGMWFLFALGALLVGTIFTIVFVASAGSRLRSAQGK